MRSHIRTRSAVLALVALTTLVVGACGDDDDDSDVSAKEETPDEASTAPSVTTPAPAAATLTATLSGAEEVPGPGIDPGTGTAEIKINGDEVCYDLKATMGEQPTAAHIHQGAKGAAGDVFVDLKPAFEAGESAFTAAACTTPAAGEAAKITADPAGFYVNIHTAAFPKGAVRGQLAKSGY